MYRYRAIHISNYRCFREFQLGDLARVNLITGPNNVGKTALLECMFQLSGPRNPVLSLNVNAFRGITEYKLELSPTATMPWTYLFHLLETEHEIEMTGHMADGPSMHLRLRDLPPEEFPDIPVQAEITPDGRQGLQALEGPQGILSSQPASRVLLLQHWTDETQEPVNYYLIPTGRGILAHPLPGAPPFPGYFLGAGSRVKLEEDVKRFDDIERRGRGDALLSAVRVLEPRLRALRLHYFAGVPMIHGDIGLSQPIPLPFMGEGPTRLASILLAISEARGGVVFVDEVDNGIYHRRLTDVWQSIAKAARETDAQVFGTTHSRECVEAAHEAFAKTGPDDLRLHRLEFAGDTVRAFAYDQETLGAAIETDLEVR